MKDTPSEKKNQQSLEDHFWRVSLHRMNPEEVHDQVVQAVQDGNIWRFKLLLQMALEEEDAAEYMKVAVENDRTEMLEAFLQRFPMWQDSVNIQDLAEKAVIGGQLQILRFFVQTGNVDLHVYDDFFLRQAAEKGHMAVVNWLLEQGADPDAREGAAVIGAAETGQFEIMKRLLDYGADFSVCAENTLDAAARNGHLTVVSWLLEHKREECKGGMEDAFLAACSGGHVPVVEALLEAGIPVDVSKNMALREAVYYNHPDVILTLLTHGADIDANDGQALSWALQKKDTILLQFLLVNGANPNVRFDRDKTPLSEAVGGGDVAIIDLLLEHGADPSFNRFQAIKRARAAGDRNITKKLVAGYYHGLEIEKLRKQQEFRETFGVDYTLEDLRQRKGSSGETGLLIAAGTGNFPALVGQAAGKEQLRPEDLFHPDDTVDMVLSRLARHKCLQHFFDQALWNDRYEEATRAWKMLPEIYKKRVSLNALNAAQDIQALKQKAKRVNRQPPR